MAYSTRSTAPASLPVSLAEAKSHCRVEITEDDSLISTYIEAAVSWVETFLRRRLITQSWTYFLDSFPDGDEIEVFDSPLLAISGFEYMDPTTGALTSFTSYTVESPSGENPGRGRIVLGYLASWPEARDTKNSVKFVASVGYGDATEVPDPIRVAILQLVAHLYANRESVISGTIVSKVPMTVEFLLFPFRLFEFK